MPLFISFSPSLSCSLAPWFLITCISLFFLIKGWRLGRQCLRGQWRPHSCRIEDRCSSFPSFQQSLHAFPHSFTTCVRPPSPPPYLSSAYRQHSLVLSQSWLSPLPHDGLPPLPRMQTPHLQLIIHSLLPLPFTKHSLCFTIMNDSQHNKNFCDTFFLAGNGNVGLSVSRSVCRSTILFQKEI